MGSRLERAGEFASGLLRGIAVALGAFSLASVAASRAAADESPL